MHEHATHVVGDNVEAELYNVEAIREQYDNWDQMSSGEKLEILEDHDPESRETHHNVITKTFREYIADLINKKVSTQGAIDVNTIAFGNDNTTPSISDTGLKNEVYRDTLDDHIDRSGEEYAATLLIQSDEAVGLDLLEGGLHTENDSSNADDLCLNRVTFSDSRMNPKDGDHAVTVTMSIDILDRSEVK